MDANGLTFLQLADGAQWRAREHARWDAGCRALGLASERALDAPPDAAAMAVALGAIDAVPRTVDRRGAVARWDADASAVVVRSHLVPDAVLLPLAETPTDLALGADGVLHVALAAGVLLHDLRGRFADTLLATPGYAPWRLAAAGPRDAAVVWAIERPGGRIARLSGMPLPERSPQPDDYAPRVFRPSPENCRPPRVDLLEGVALPTGERPVAIAAAPDGRLGVLSWRADGVPLLRLLEGGTGAAGPGAPGAADGRGGDAPLPAARPGDEPRRGAGVSRHGAGAGAAEDDDADDEAARRGAFEPASRSLAQTLSPPVELAGARHAYAFAWLDAVRVAVRLPGRRDAPSFDLQPWLEARRAGREPPARAAALGEVHPLAAGAAEAPFAHRVEGPPRYPLGAAAGGRAGGVEPLLALSVRRLARRGTAAHWRRVGAALDAHVLDGGTPGIVWHRLVAEASIPAGTGFVAWVAATADAEPPADDDVSAWHPHGFGDAVVALAPAAFAGPVPRAAWERAPSELPGHPGLAPWPPEPGRRGLFGVLLQDATRRVRRIAGRYLWLRVELFGDGRATPEIVALRAWAGRFDYVDHYLPALYRESHFGAEAEAPGVRVATLGAGLPQPRLDELAGLLDAGDAAAGALRDALAALPAEAWAGAGGGVPAALALRTDAAGLRWRLADAAGHAWHLARDADGGGIGMWRPQATPADFLSRLLCSFEGVLTTLEDRVAAAHLATHPATVPAAQLDWLAGWIGVAFDPALPEARRRDWLAAAPRLARWHGTRRGLALALDLATGGGVREGRIVVVEDFRLRRLLATLLGVDLADEGDPLLPGLHRSGNSVVGDTLVLGEAAGVELLALFRAEVAQDEAEHDAVRAFRARLAHAATVLVHDDTGAQDLGLIRRIAGLEAPAHVEVRVERASWPLLVGVASLVGVDTFLGPPRRPRAARADGSALGMGDLVLHDATLDPRLAGAAAPPLAPSPRPRADAGADRAVAPGASFVLDGSGSRAAPGRSIVQYVWRRLPPDP